MKALKKTKSLNQPAGAKVTWERYLVFALKGESVKRHKINVIVVCVNLRYLATGIIGAVHGMWSLYAWRTSGLAKSSLSIESRLYAGWCNRFYNQTWRWKRPHASTLVSLKVKAFFFRCRLFVLQNWFTVPCWKPHPQGLPATLSVTPCFWGISQLK